MAPRALPNILVTGTPGTGKSTMAQALVAAAPALRTVDVSALVKDKGLHSGWDAEYESYVVDEDQVCDELEDAMEAGGVVVDYHGADLFPERWFDLCLVLRTDNSTLYGRLEARGYAAKKITENVEAEIMQVILDETREAYAAEVIVELPSNSIEDIESNVGRATAWMQSWAAQRDKE